MSNKIKLLIVDDHQIVRDGLVSLLSELDDIEIIGEVSGYNNLIELLKDKQTDIILMDISMPDKSGIEITDIITTDFPDIKVLVLSMYLNEDFIINALKAGAKGYLPKNTTKKELLEAIHVIYNGDEYFSKPIADIIMKSYVKKIKAEDDISQKDNTLSSREMEILKLFVEGLTNSEIADKLFISIRTVESHKNHIMQKMGFKSTVDMVKYAIKNNIAKL